MNCVTQQQTMKHCDAGQSDEEKAAALRDMIIDKCHTFKTEDGMIKISAIGIIDELAQGDVWLKGLLMAGRHSIDPTIKNHINDEISSMAYDKCLAVIRDYEL